MQPRSRRLRQTDQRPSPSAYSSAIDPLLRLESHFLQRFFRWNLVDHFHEAFLSLEEDLLDRRPRGKHLRDLSAEIFTTRKDLNINEFAKKIDQFYRINSRELPNSFRLLYSNAPEEAGEDLREGEVVVMRVRMRADVDKIEELPAQFYRDVEMANS